MVQEEERLRNKYLKPWSYYSFAHKDLERGKERVSRALADMFLKSERGKLLSTYTLMELFQELHRRAQDDVEEDEEIDWEDELSQLHYQKLAKQFPHYFDKREVN